MTPNRNKLSERFFTGITEQTFQSRLGVADPTLVDYLAGLLVRFIHKDGLYAVRAPSGRRLNDVVEMVAEAEQRTGRSRRQVLRHIGDFTLFWTGVYPEALEKLKAARRLDCFVDYSSQGKRSYMMAALEPLPETEPTTDAPDADLLQRLADDYEMCAYGLSEVRKEWERTTPDEGGSAGLWLA